MQVDVVTAVHASHAAFLPAAWRSLLDQSHTRWRWLVQLDGPADEAREALKSCGAMDDPRVSVASHGTSEGPAVTRNVALGRTSAPSSRTSTRTTNSNPAPWQPSPPH